MITRRLPLLTGIIMVFVLLFGIIGCKQTINSPQDNLSESDLSVFDMTDAFSGIQDATIDSPLYYDSPVGHLNYFRRNFDPGRSGRHLFRILKSLDLTDAQKTDVKTFITDFKSCADSAADKFRYAIAPILDSANSKRQTIIDSVKNGLLSREAAKLEIRNLNLETREQIKNDPAVLAVQLDLCDCKKTLFYNISSILDSSQKTKWDDWVSKLSGLCTGD